MIFFFAFFLFSYVLWQYWHDVTPIDLEIHLKTFYATGLFLYPLKTSVTWNRLIVCWSEWALALNPLQPNIAIHIETSHLFCKAKQMTGFYMKCNTGLNLVNHLKGYRKVLVEMYISSHTTKIVILYRMQFFIWVTKVKL